MQTFSIEEVPDLARKDTKKALTHLKEKIPNQFVTMASLLTEFGSNARTHIKNLEGVNTFRIKRFNEQGKAKKETDFWVYIIPELLSKAQIDAFVLVLRQEINEKKELRYPNVSFEVSPQVEVTKPKKVKKVKKVKKTEKVNFYDCLDCDETHMDQESAVIHQDQIGHKILHITK